MLQRIGLTLQIEQRNKLTTKVCGGVVGQMEKDGLRCCVLKGQANHRYYPRGWGIAGRVGMWTFGWNHTSFRFQVPSFKFQVRKVLEYVDAHWERTGLCWLHCNFTEKSGVPVEVHFHPSFFSRPKYNKRFQNHFADIEQCVEDVLWYSLETWNRKGLKR